ncbi:hypothetical protein GGR62_000468 [Xanthomonas campestris]|nr:hypothetical protein [Xanthomonas sp. 3075]
MVLLHRPFTHLPRKQEKETSVPLARSAVVVPLSCLRERGSRGERAYRSPRAMLENTPSRRTQA